MLCRQSNIYSSKNSKCSDAIPHQSQQFLKLAFSSHQMQKYFVSFIKIFYQHCLLNMVNKNSCCFSKAVEML